VAFCSGSVMAGLGRASSGDQSDGRAVVHGREKTTWPLTAVATLESAWSLSMMSTGGCRPRWPSSAKSWRDQMFALASLTDIPGRLRLI